MRYMFVHSSVSIFMVVSYLQLSGIFKSMLLSYIVVPSLSTHMIPFKFWFFIMMRGRVWYLVTLTLQFWILSKKKQDRKNELNFFHSPLDT